MEEQLEDLDQDLSLSSGIQLLRLSVARTCPSKPILLQALQTSN